MKSKPNETYLTSQNNSQQFLIKIFGKSSNVFYIILWSLNSIQH